VRLQNPYVVRLLEGHVDPPRYLQMVVPVHGVIPLRNKCPV
jgi:hypothetical protein